VDAADEPPHPFEGLGIFQLRGAPAAPRIHSEAEPGVLVERAADENERRDDRDLALGELGDERVLFVDLCVGPARRPVELRHDRRAFFQEDLVDAVLVAVERDHAPVAAQADGLERVEDDVGSESGVGMRPRLGRASGVPGRRAQSLPARIRCHPTPLQNGHGRDSNVPVCSHDVQVFQPTSRVAALYSPRQRRPLGLRPQRWLIVSVR
jgi:hypothetical protein